MQTPSVEIPTFVVDAKRRFQCPKCGKTNLHGQGDGHRASHCPCWPTGYYIVSSARNTRQAVAPEEIERLSRTDVTARQLAEVIVDCDRWEPAPRIFTISRAFAFAKFNPDGSLVSRDPYDPRLGREVPSRTNVPLAGDLALIDVRLNVAFFEGVSQLFVDAVTILVNERPSRVVLFPAIPRRRSPYKRLRHVRGYFAAEAKMKHFDARTVAAVRAITLTTVAVDPRNKPAIALDTDGNHDGRIVHWPILNF
jgi:hypothetical protein